MHCANPQISSKAAGTTIDAVEETTSVSVCATKRSMHHANRRTDTKDAIEKKQQTKSVSESTKKQHLPQILATVRQNLWIIAGLQPLQRSKDSLGLPKWLTG
jgi:hypothetical protein